jgi:hypothetical protein
MGFGFNNFYHMVGYYGKQVCRMVASFSNILANGVEFAMRQLWLPSHAPAQPHYLLV